MVAINGIEAGLQVPATDGTANIATADVIGSKADNVIQAIASTVSLMGYVKGTLRAITGSGGLGTFPAAAVPANGVNLSAAVREIYDQLDKVAVKSAATMVNAQTIFTIVGGPILIDQLLALCVTTNDGTGSTMQYQANPTVGSAATISGATTTLASIAAGATITLSPTALSTAPVIALAAAGGVQLGLNVSNRIIIPEGTLKIVIGVGSTTGTWSHHIRYRPLARGIVVS